jgi:MFS family permease
MSGAAAKPAGAVIPILMLITFVGMLGFGLVNPMIPLYATKLGLTPETATLIVASYSFAQFVGAPLWGKISDAFGRKRVLIWTTAGAMGGYALLAFADSIALLLAARVISGFCAGNLTAAQAFASDVTSPQERAGAMGKIGSAFALGTVAGPAVGGLLAGGTSYETANFMAPPMAACLMSLLAMLLTIFVLPASPPPRAPRTGAEDKAARRLWQRPVFVMLVAITLLAFATTASRESVLSLWLHDRWSLATAEMGLLFSYNGLVITLFQGFGTGWMTKKIGDANMVRLGVIAYALGLVGLALAPSFPFVIAATTLNAIGVAVFSANLPSVFSQNAAPHERGLVLGLFQSSGALARFIGPTYAGSLYAQFGANAPFLFGAALLMPALLISLFGLTRVNVSRAPTSTMKQAD